MRQTQHHASESRYSWWFGCCKTVMLEIKTELLQASNHGLGLYDGRVLIWQYFQLVELFTVESRWDLRTLIRTEDGIKPDLSSPFCPWQTVAETWEGSNIEHVLMITSLSAPLQRVKRCTRDRCCPSHPSPWRSVFWGPCVWPSTAAASKDTHPHIHMNI